MEAQGKPIKLQILAVLEFNSDRKRMSVLCRLPDGRSVLPSFLCPCAPPPLAPPPLASLAPSPCLSSGLVLTAMPPPPPNPSSSCTPLSFLLPNLAPPPSSHPSPFPPLLSSPASPLLCRHLHELTEPPSAADLCVRLYAWVHRSAHS